jgi:hypothetical protein
MNRRRRLGITRGCTCGQKALDQWPGLRVLADTERKADRYSGLGQSNDLAQVSPANSAVERPILSGHRREQASRSSAGHHDGGVGADGEL